MADSFKQLISRVRSCTLCASELHHGVRPVIQAHPQATILIAGQAPGARVHDTGVPFDDPSGDRLRDWMGIDRNTFYDETRIAIVPMGLCYPGKGKSGDLPPQAICSKTWHQQILDAMPRIKLKLVIGQYAQAWHLETQGKNLTETVRGWASYDEQLIPLPHPSPRNNIWLKKNPWFEAELVPHLKQRVNDALEK